jgi:hypothetical protein
MTARRGGVVGQWVEQRAHGGGRAVSCRTHWCGWRGRGCPACPCPGWPAQPEATRGVRARHATRSPAATLRAAGPPHQPAHQRRRKGRTDGARPMRHSGPLQPQALTIRSTGSWAGSACAGPPPPRWWTRSQRETACRRSCSACRRRECGSAATTRARAPAPHHVNTDPSTIMPMMDIHVCHENGCRNCQNLRTRTHAHTRVRTHRRS